MRRKLLSVLLVFIMVLSLTAPAFAAGPVITASYNKKSETVTIKVDDVTEVFTGIGNNTTKTYTVNGWELNVTAKNDVATINSKKQVAKPEAVTEAPKTVEVSASYNKGAKTLTIKVGDVTETIVGVSNNTTMTFTVGGWDVNITAKNDVATINYKSEVAPAVVDNGVVADPELRIVEVQQSWSKTTFHCNTFGGNGRVWPQVGPYSKKSDGHITTVLEEVPGTTYWKLIDVKDTLTGVSYGVPTCPGKHQYCGSCEWISYSNNSGVPNGKNIQLHHSMPGDDEGEFNGTITLVKTVNGIEINKYSYEGEGSILSLITGFELYTTTGNGGDKGDFVSFAPLDLNGSILFEGLADGWYIVEELLTAEGEEFFETADLFYVQIVNEVQVGGLKTAKTYIPEGPYTSKTLAERSAMAILTDDGTIISPTGDPVINTWLKEQFETNGEIVSYGNLMSYDVTVNDLTAFYVIPNGAVSEGGFIPGGIALTAEQERLMIAALDWVYVTYGSFETLNTIQNDIAQALVWKIIGTIELNDSYSISKIVAFNGSQLSEESTLTITPDFINGVLADCLEAYAAREAAGDMRVVGLLSLQSSFVSSQCLLVPYFGETTGGGFNNMPKVIYSDLSLKKTVDGIAIADVIYEGEGSIFDLIEGFNLYKSTGNGEAKGEFVAFAELDEDGGIIFEHLVDGWYVIEEILTPAGEKYFEIPDLFYVNIVNGKTVAGNGVAPTYNVGDKFNFLNLHSDIKTWPGTSSSYFYAWMTAYGSQQEGNVRSQTFRVSDADGNVYPAFCARYSSPGNAESYDVGVIDETIKARLISALNYINNTWNTENGGLFDEFDFDGDHGVNDPGSQYHLNDAEKAALWATLKENQIRVYPKVLAQFVVWAIIHEAEGLSVNPYHDGHVINGMNSEAFNNIIKVESYAGHTGLIKDLVYLVGDADWVQPVVVPIPGELVFDNKTTDYDSSNLSFEKKVAGMNIVDWLTEYYTSANADEVLEGLEFYLDGENGHYGPVTPDLYGIVTFNEVIPGAYTLSEKITGAAIGVFKKMADIELELADGDNKVFVLGGTVNGNIEEFRFNDDDLFTIIRGYGYGIRSLGFSSLTGGGELFYIGVTNTVTGVDYTSFCAHGGSKNFAGDNHLGCKGYMVVERAGIKDLANKEMDAQYESILAALNWIQDNVGALREGYDASIPNGWVTPARVVAQVTIWALLGNIDVNSDSFANSYLTAEEKALVLAALDAAEAGYFGDIVDLVYLVCEEHENFEFCQPQIVPIFGTFYVENEVEEEFEYNGAIVASFDVEASREVVTYDYRPNYDTKTGSITADARGSTTHNWFGMTTLNVEAVKENPIILNQLRYGNGANDLYDFGYTISIDVNGYIWIDFGALEVGAYIELMTFNGIKGVFNSNGTHVTYTGRINTGLNVGSADEVYLYVHLDSITYFNGSYTRYEVSRTSEEVAYTGTLTLTIKDEAGNDVYSKTGKITEFDFDLYGMLEISGNCPIGTYTATLSGDGFAAKVITLELTEEVTQIEFIFDPISVEYDANEIDPGEPA